jgi:hypothetical protein
MRVLQYFQMLGAIDWMTHHIHEGWNLQQHCMRTDLTYFCNVYPCVITTPTLSVHFRSNFTCQSYVEFSDLVLLISTQLMLWFTRPVHYKSPSEKLGTLVSLLNLVLVLHEQLLGFPLCYTYAVKAKNFNWNLLELSALLSPCHAMKSVWYIAHVYNTQTADRHVA